MAWSSSIILIFDFLIFLFSEGSLSSYEFSVLPIVAIALRIYCC